MSNETAQLLQAFEALPPEKKQVFTIRISATISAL